MDDIVNVSQDISFDSTLIDIQADLSIPSTWLDVDVASSMLTMDTSTGSPGQGLHRLLYTSPNVENADQYYSSVANSSRSQLDDNSNFTLPSEYSADSSEQRLDHTTPNMWSLISNQAQLDVSVQDWVDNAYATGFYLRDHDLRSHPVNGHSIQQDWQHVTQPLHVPGGTMVAQALHTPDNLRLGSIRSHGQYSCDYPNCTHTDPRLSDLRRHMRYHTPMWRRPHRCVQCIQRFHFPHELRRHMTSHSGDRIYQCTSSHCAIRFTRHDNLLRHLRVRHRNGR